MNDEKNRPLFTGLPGTDGADLFSESGETGVYQDIIMDSPTAIYVCDCASCELLYINSSARALCGLGEEPILGRKCYEAFMHRDSPCPFCERGRLEPGVFYSRSYKSQITGRTFILTGKRLSWNGKDAHIEYVTDDTARANALEALQKKLREQECISACNRHLSGDVDFTGSIKHILAEIGSYYGAQRCVLMEVDARQGRVRKLSRWTRETMDEYPQSMEFGLNDYLPLAQRMGKPDCRTTENVEQFKESDPALYAFLCGMNITNIRSASFELDDVRQAYLAVFNSDMTDPDSSLLSQIAFYIQHALTRYYTSREFEEAFTLAARQSGLVVWRYDVLTKTIVCRNNTLNVYGYGDRISDVPQVFVSDKTLHPDDAYLVKDMYDQIDAGAKAAGCVARWRRPGTGEWWWSKISYTTIFDQNGAPVRAIGSSVDVTEEKAAQQRYDDEVDYRKSLGGNLVSTHRVNLTRGIVEESHSDIHRVSIPPNTPIDNATFQKYCDASIPDGAQRAEYYKKFNPERLLRLYYEGETGSGMEYRALLPDGSFKWVEAQVNLVKRPETEEIIAFLNSWDIDEKKTIQAMVDTVVNMNFDYLSLLDLKSNHYFIFAKSATKTPLPPLTGDNYSAAVEEYSREHMVPEDVERNILEMSCESIKKNLENQSIYTTYCSIRESDGRISHKLRQFSYLDRDEEKVILIRADVTDIFENEQRKNEALTAALTAAEQASAAKSDFLSRMSHEIRTPMNAIIGMTTIAAQSVGDDEQVADCLSKIGISSRFLLSLINDILDMSRIESGKILLKKERIPFADFIGGINTLCYAQARSKNVDYECVVDHNTEDYYIGDAMKLQQILINILSNAVKFTPENGKVSLRVCQMKRMKKNASVRFVVNDTGCGISEEFMPYLFEPFEQENTGTTAIYGGTGLGLAICKNLAELMDGKIHVRSIVGVGSEFTVDLKLGVCEEAKLPSDSKTHVDFTKLKALVVDDDVTVCQHTHIILNDIGVQSEWVDSGRKAIEKVAKKWEEQAYYDLILIDWKMPEMDGIETARRIRQIVGPDVTIIIMTAYDWQSIENEAKLAGVNLMMSKPMFRSTLISAFEKAIGGKNDEIAVPMPKEYDFTGKRLLLAEDHPLNVEVAKHLLERIGFKVEVAENGVRAVEMFTVSPEGYYDAVLMDIRMPVMDGLQATCSIRHLSKADAKTIPIIAMTANAFDDDVEKSKQVGMNAHLAKPIEPDTLYQTLERFITNA